MNKQEFMSYLSPEYGYQFQQTKEQAIIEITNDTPITTDDVVLEHRPEEGTICIAINKQDVVYGKLSASITDSRCEVSDNKVKITLDKAAPGEWLVLISGPSDKGIDARSEFLLGWYSGEEDQHAWGYFKNAAERGYEPALGIVGHAFFDEENAYGVEKDPAEALKYFKMLYEKHPESEAAYFVAIALQKLERYEEACDVLREVTPSNTMKQVFAKLFIEMNKPVSITVGLRFLNSFAKATSLSNTVTLSLTSKLVMV